VAAAQHGLERRPKTALADVKGELTIDDVLAAAHDGDEFALSLVRAVGRVHGWVAHQINELFNPEKIIFAGPLADLGDLFLASVRATARELGDAGRDLVIANSTLGQYNGAVGAAALALHQWKPKR
jgi:predicted NBD/HSP70 family sugar kinase